jgi:predicted GNAT family acetyltransferase
MREAFNTIPLHKNEEKRRFEIEVDGSFAFIDYKETDSQIALVHTETEPALAGKGAASAVVEKTLIYIEQSKKTVLPYCSYVFTFIKKHPQWKRIVNERFEDYNKLY